MDVELRSVIERLRDLKDYFLERLEAEQSAFSYLDEGPVKETQRLRIARAQGNVEAISIAIQNFESVETGSYPSGGDAA